MAYVDKDKQRAYHREYQQRPKRKEYKKAWDRRNRERLAEMQRARYKADPEKYRAYFRNWRVKKVYGITPAQYEQTLSDQGGVCAVCGRVPNGSSRMEKTLLIDHDHETGKIRGLLCNNCNSGMGIMGDTEEHLLAALAYLRKHKEA